MCVCDSTTNAVSIFIRGNVDINKKKTMGMIIVIYDFIIR